ncbi:MAG TPA: type II toxin-antitoxin system VapC family toxin [Candidatus Dormibacteraeota bacterium]|nr:type II toxin-antitoxin system VapC family toxin [Candidatus Dormibacteraeota bacterium]
MLLDTNFLIDLSHELEDRRIGPARNFLTRHRKETHAISVISFGEFAAGMEDSQAARDFVARFRVIASKPEIALAAAAIDRDLIATGQRLGENDNWIAGVARYYGIPLASNDEAFDRVRNLRRLPY